MKNKMKRSCSILAILFLGLWPISYAQSCNGTIAGQDTAQIALVKSSVASDLANGEEPFRRYSAPTIKIRDYVESNAGEEFPFRLYVTPEDQAIKALAAEISGVKDAYELAVQWISISDQKLNYVPDKWLTPHEFLVNTPHYLSNPVKGKEVSDCEEQAYTLVSLIRAEGIPSEEVRVALGKVKFNDVETGHAWVELLTNGRWMALDPGYGPYWDDRVEKLVRRRGVPFDYYTGHTYPAVQVWAYFNDIYYLDPGDSSGNAPVSWRKAATAK